MPCMCWFDPPEDSKRLIKNCCQQIIDELKRLHQLGDPVGLELKDVKFLLDHLWEPESCDERDGKNDNL